MADIHTIETSSDSMPAVTPGRTARRLSDRTLFLVAFVLLLVLKSPDLTLPTSHDASWGLFPAAQTLAETGFDYPALLDEPGFEGDGPSTHALSIVTLPTAFVIWLLGPGTATLIVLHVLHLMLGAWTLLSTYRLARMVVAEAAAILVVIAVVATPVVFTQFGFVYLEIPLAAFTLASARAYAEERMGRAVLWAVAAAAVKASGIAVVGALALLLLGRGRRRERWLAGAGVTAAAVLAFLSVLGRDSTAGRDFAWDRVTEIWRIHLRYLSISPLTVMTAGAFALTFVALLLRPRGDAAGDRALAAAGAIPILFVAFHFLAPVAGQTVNLLPRYWVVPIPLMLVVIGAMLSRFGSARVAVAIAATYLVLAVLGMFGFMTPGWATADSIMAERTPAHADLMRLYDRSFDVLIASDAVPLARKNDVFRLTYTADGFVDESVTDFARLRDVADLPPHIIWVDRGLSDKESALDEQLGPGWTIETKTLTEGPFTFLIHEARRTP
jgi:hypothetical protein